MNKRTAGPKAASSSGEWQKTQYSNLIRYVPSSTYYARVRVVGKLIRKSLKTDVLTVAKLRLADLEKSEREAVESRDSASKGRMTFGVCVAIFKTQTETSSLLKPSAKHYRHEVLDSICRSWPGIEARDVHRFIKRARVRPRHLTLPDSGQFDFFVKEIESASGRDSRKCADMVRFLAFGGFRLSEARNITWADCDFEKGEIIVRGDPETGTKNWSIRRVPMIPEMKQLLERLREERPQEPLASPVMRVKECLQAMTRAARVVGMARITHHDLRHLFATRCIESGVDIPTVSRWLGHKDGGALAMKVYGHLRDQHSVAMAQKVMFSKPQPENVIQMPNQKPG